MVSPQTRLSLSRITQKKLWIWMVNYIDVCETHWPDPLPVASTGKDITIGDT